MQDTEEPEENVVFILLDEVLLVACLWPMLNHKYVSEPPSSSKTQSGRCA